MTESEFKKSALLAIEALRARVRELEDVARQDIAIIGLAARFPGADDADAFWSLLEQGRDAVTEVPPDRWDVDAFYDANPDAPGKMVTRRAGFLGSVSEFDAHFFGISPREAMYMDPQHRLLLESTWHALEHAGVSPDSLMGTRTGVFMGLSTHEYLGLLTRHTAYEAIDMYLGTGTSPAAGIGRISYRLGLQGPAVTVDTACSSSLVAIHQASQALRAGECEVALAGGVNVILNPSPMIIMSRARLAAPDGRCKTFDAAADGYVRGEGCGVVVLKRLVDAQRDGDRIRAVIRGSAVNQDGASGGLTAPNGRAQQRVIQEALSQAGLEPGQVDFLEAHGTGTALGDPIEVQAAAATYGPGRAGHDPLLLGSVKTNIGHLEAAAGIAGVIKIVLALEHGLLPKHLHFNTPSPHIPWSKLPVQVVRDATPWTANGKRRAAGVSSFGFSGTNAHVILEEAPTPATVPSRQPGLESPPRRYYLLPISARTPEAFRDLLARYTSWLEGHPGASLSDVCYTAGVGRSHLSHRAALVVDSVERTRRMLNALAEDRPAPGVFTGTSADPPKTAWLFTGQGSQYAGMARQLFDSEPVFRRILEQCDDLLRDVLEKPLLEVIFGDGALLGHTSYAQPAIFALEMGLARLWESWGLQSDVVLGHSVGQYAAACVAGVFSMEDGLRLIAERGRLMGALPEGGSMAAIFADAAAVEASIAGRPKVSVAAYNGAHAVVSGPKADVAAVVQAFQEKDVRCEPLDTSHAFHSALMEPALAAFEQFAQQFTFRPVARTLICNRTGKVMTAQTVLDAAYWRRHARQAVQFAASVDTLNRLGCKVLLEVGPQPVLTAMAQRAWPDAETLPVTIPSLKRGIPDSRQVLEALAQLYVSGSRPDFKAVDGDGPHSKLDLPIYPFQRRPFWFPVTRQEDRTVFVSHALPEAPVVAGEAGADDPGAATVDPSALAATSPAESAFLTEADAWLMAIDPAAREARIIEFLRTEMGRALGVEPGTIDLDSPFAALGIDSLTATELRSRVQSALGTSVPATTFVFTYPNVRSLASGLLELWNQSRVDPSKRVARIPRVPREGELPLSHAQEQLWFMQQLLPSSGAYNVAARIRIRGPLDHATLALTFDALVERHEVLRTTFPADQGVPRVAIAPMLHMDLPVQDVRGEAEIAAIGLREAGTPFGLASGPLFRVRLLRADEDDHTLLVTMHHIITDGWSLKILSAELGELYGALRRGEPARLPELSVQYVDYAAWHQEWLQSKGFEDLLAFWKRDLSGAPLLDLPSDRPRPATPSYRGSRIRFELGPARTERLRAFCAAENLTVFVPLLAAFATLLQRHSGQDDFVIGTLSANRTRLEVENLLGFFVNVLPVRVGLDGDPTVRELMSRLRDRVREVMTHQEVPFDLIVNAVERKRDTNRNPLFQVQLVLQAAVRNLSLDGLDIEIDEIDTETAKRDLTLTIYDDASMSAHVEFARDLFDAVRIEQLIHHFETLLDGMTVDPHQRVAGLSLLSESEQALYAPRRGTRVQSVQQMFELAVDRAPDAVAVRAGDRSMTYRQLDAAANRVARWLQSRGVGPNTAVALRVGRTLDAPVGLLGILKAGGVYVPIDPAYPAQRADYMCADAGVALRIEQVDGPEIARESGDRLNTATEPDHLAYVIYTSGSTGTPKGVMVTHESVIDYAYTLGRALGIEPEDVCLQTASISFSSSIRQILVPLMAGATVVVADLDECRDPLALLCRIRDSHVTVADLVPTIVRHVVDAVAGLPLEARASLTGNDLRLLLTASEPLRFGLVHEWRTHFGRRARWFNMYGQTETTGIVSLYSVQEAGKDDQRIVPIGRPRDNVTLLVLDRQRRPLPRGVVGDLYAGGTALARGYTGDPALTAERFLPNALGDGERLYVSGDLARLGWDGTIEFLGRSDQQVKVRGLRIEPVEIERVLLEHPGVRETVVIVSGDGSGGPRLVAYYTSTVSQTAAGALREHARQRLPEHMLPAAFVALEHMPLTTNGKINRAALPEPDHSTTTDIEHVEPRPGTEEALAGIWRKVLRVERVGAGDNFFSLGGHSLLAAQVRSQVRSVCGVDLPLPTIFEDQTLAALALRIDASRSAAAGRSMPPLVRVPRGSTMPASFAQELMWRAEGEDPGSPGHWIDVGLRIRGPLDTHRLVDSVQEAVGRHEILRTVYRLSGAAFHQVILDACPLDVPVTAVATGAGDGDGREPGDLTARPPIRATLVRTSDEDHLLHVRVHRIVADGLATRLLLSEIGALYMNAADGTSHFPLLETSLQYADYAAWEREWLTPNTLQPHLDFFRHQFAGLDAAFLVPTDRPRPVERLRRGARVRFEFPRSVSDTARAVAAQVPASLYTVLLAAFASALGRYTGRKDVVIGSPVSRRTPPGTDQMIGPFMNIVPLRIDCSPAANRSMHVSHVRDVLLGALAHQDAPFHHVTAALAAEHGPAASGVGEVAFVMGDQAPREITAGGLSLVRVESDRPSSRRDMTVSVTDVNGDIGGTVTYDRDLFDGETIEGLLADCQAVLGSGGA